MRTFGLKIMILLVVFGGVSNAGLCAVNNFSDKYTDDTFNQYNYRYKMVAVDTRSWTKNKKDILRKRKIITNFGDALGTKAIVQNLIEKTSKKRAYVTKIQKQLSTSYHLDNAPFLIFFKKEKKSYQPYRIISLASVSEDYLKGELSLLSKAINSGSSNKKVYAGLEQVREKIYAKNQKSTPIEKETINTFIETLKSWFS